MVKKFIRHHLGIFINLIIIILELVIFITCAVLKTNPYICEWWSRTIARYYQVIVGSITKYIPFSFTEMLVVSLVISTIVLIVLIVIALKKRNYNAAIRNTLTIGSSIFSIFVTFSVCMSLNYNRLPIPIKLYEERVQQSEYKEIVQYFADDFSRCADELDIKDNGELIMPHTISELNYLIAKEYEKLNDDYYTSFTTNMKPMVSSFLYREFRITGLYFASTGEANLNYQATAAEIPFVITHELAHSKGVARENDANLLATYLLLNSSDPYLRFSAYTYSFSSIIMLLNFTGVDTDYSEVYFSMNQKIFLNQRWNYEYWQHYGAFYKFADWFNNLFLVNNGVSEGTGSYDDEPEIDDDDPSDIAFYSPYQKLYFEYYFNVVK